MVILFLLRNKESLLIPLSSSCHLIHAYLPFDMGRLAPNRGREDLQSHRWASWSSGESTLTPANAISGVRWLIPFHFCSLFTFRYVSV